MWHLSVGACPITLIVVSILMHRTNPRSFGDGRIDLGPEWIAGTLLLAQHLISVAAAIGVCWITQRTGLRLLAFAWIVLVLGLSYFLAFYASMAITGFWL
jgi:hypothetical protein